MDGCAASSLRCTVRPGSGREDAAGPSRLFRNQDLHSMFSPLRRYSIAVAAVAAATGATWLAPSLRSTPTPLFLVAVLVSAWYGRTGPALFATALSVFAI